jgi:PAS domain S-box-containing protein
LLPSPPDVRSSSTARAVPSLESGFLPSESETGRLIASFDWRSTALGPFEAWPQSLKTMLSTMLRSPVPIVLLWGAEGVMLYNDAYSAFAGGRHPRLLGSKVREGWPEVADFNDNVMRVGLAGGALSYQDQELTLYRQGRPEQVCMNLDYSPVLDDGGRYAGVICILTETTERVAAERRERQAESELRDERDRLASVLGGMAEGFALLSNDFRILHVNDEALRLAARPREAVVGRTHWEIYPGSEHGELGRLYKQAMTERAPLTLEHRYAFEDGRNAWLETRAFPVGAGLAIFYRDVSERRRAEESLRASEERLRLVIEGATDYAILTFDLDRRVTSWSAGAQATFGYCASEIIGLRYDVLFTPEDQEADVPAREVEKARREGLAPDVRYHLRRDGSCVFVNGTVRPLRDADGRELGFLKVARDETDRRASDDLLRETEERYRLAARATNDAIWDWDLTTDRVRWNEAVQVLFGFAPEQVGPDGLWWKEHIHPSDRGRVLASIQAIIDGAKDTWVEQYRFRRADGAYATVFDRGTVLRDEAGVAIRMIGAMLDLTERKQAEERLQASEARFEAIANSVNQLIWSTRPDGYHDYYNDRWYEYTGVPPNSTDGEAWNGMFHPDDQERAWARWRRSLATGEPYHIEYRLRHRSGEYRWVIGRAQSVRDSKGRITRWFGTCTDVHDLKAAEAALRESEARLKAVFDTVPVGIVMAEAPSGRIVGGNAQAERIFGHPVLPSPDVESYRNWVSRHADGRKVEPEDYPLTCVIRGKSERAELEVLYHRGDGREAWVRLIAAPILGDGGSITGGVVASLDIDREKRAEAELRRLNETLEAEVADRTADRDRMWRLSTDLMLVARLDATITALNPAWQTMFGWKEEELIGASFLDLVHPEDRSATIAETARLAGGNVTSRFENRYRAKDGSYRWLSWTAVPDEAFIHAVGRDVTTQKLAAMELERAQDALRQSQKMETVGQLTGGVAHDFNNLLQIVTGNLEILQRNLPTDSPRLRRAADNAQTGAKRAATLTQRLLAFSRRQPLAPKTIDVNRLVGSMSELLHRTLGETIELETVLASGLWRVEADPNQLENALLNLAVNARDAMQDGGKLTIETSNTHLDRGYTAQNAEVVPGQYVAICVSDTGVGMDEATASRVFEPFFTTKEVGKGTGLGLSMVYGFVKQSGGHVKIYSEPGQGTTVRIYLPRLLGSVEEDEEVIDFGAPEGSRDETILVCEDDDDVRAYSVQVLRELGYRVLEAHDGPSALRLLERQEGRVDLLFSDVVLPGGMTGADVAAAARRLRPSLKVLFTTGYARDAIVHHGRLDAGVELVTKPFAYADLAARVRDLLDKDGSA